MLPRKRLDDEGPRIIVVKKPRLDQKLVDCICEQAQRGLPIDAICDFLGIWSNDVWLWLKRGEKIARDGECPAEHEIYYEFFVRFRQATAKYRSGLVEELAGRNWVRAMATLERVDRKSFSRYNQDGSQQGAADPDERFL